MAWFKLNWKSEKLKLKKRIKSAWVEIPNETLNKKLTESIPIRLLGVIKNQIKSAEC